MLENFSGEGEGIEGKGDYKNGLKIFVCKGLWFLGEKYLKEVGMKKCCQTLQVLRVGWVSEGG